ncbi:MAG: amino acid adenylation domain-containing protein, partial [Rhodothermales bacterium]|nr:amino acid adenylation domain-containing protein [Rhodothermales bacterium]
ETLLRAAATRPDAPIAELDLLPETERDRLASWNRTEADYDLGRTLPELLEAQAARTPDAVAVVAESGAAARLTYGELDRRVRALAARLQGLGVGRDDRVAVCMERSAELVVALLGVVRAGAAYVPVDPGYPAERQAFMLADCGAGTVLTQARLAEGLAVPEGATVVAVDAVWAELDVEASPEVVAAPESLAYVIYTSGSTGRPKGAMIEHRSIVNRLLWKQEHFGLAASDVVLQKTPYSFDVSVWEFFWPLMVGARLVMAEPEGHKDPAYLARVIEREGVTTLHFVPSMLSLFLEGLEAGRVGSLRRVICSGEALGVGLRDRFFAALPDVELTNLYGPTEAAVDVSWWRCSADGSPWRVPIGWPVANTELHVLDAGMRPVPIGVAGELWIGGVQVGRGYLNRPELTEERFVADPFREGGRLYRTGDRARFLADGAIEYLGRLDHQVKVAGVRIEPGEIEARLTEHDCVRDAVVVVNDDRLVAYVAAEGEAPDTDALRAWTGETLPPHMVPALFVTLDALPLTPSGKVDRRALPEPGPSSLSTTDRVA